MGALSVFQTIDALGQNARVVGFDAVVTCVIENVATMTVAIHFQSVSLAVEAANLLVIRNVYAESIRRCIARAVVKVYAVERRCTGYDAIHCPRLL